MVGWRAGVSLMRLAGWAERWWWLLAAVSGAPSPHPSPPVPCIPCVQGGGGSEADWLAMEKRVVVIHRLHQILEPFMLRRQVEDVESKLPAKVPVVVKVAMSPYQSTIYSWIKASGGWVGIWVCGCA